MNLAKPIEVCYKNHHFYEIQTQKGKGYTASMIYRISTVYDDGI